MSLIGKTVAEKIWNYLKSKGFNDYACAGIIGNFDCESGLNPKNLQDSCQTRLGFDDETYTALVDSGVYTRAQFIYDQAGYGLSQITWHTRKQSMYDFAKSRGSSIGDLETQLEFFYKELSESFHSVLQALMSATSVREASDIMLLKYECPADMSTPAQIKRASFGQKYYTQFVTNSMKGVENMGYLYFTKGQSVKVSEHFVSTEFDCHGSGCCSQTIVNEKLIEYLEKIRNHFNTLAIRIENMRSTIIDFASYVSDGERPVTKEQFARVFKMYKEYEGVITRNGLTNGEVDIAIRIVKDAYEQHLRTHSFIEDSWDI